MTVFDDYEPEDAWHPDDLPSEQVRNLLARLALLITSDGMDFISDLDLIEDVLARLRPLRPLPRDVLRADDLAADIAFVRGRL